MERDGTETDTMQNRANRRIFPAVVIGVLLLGAGRPDGVVPSVPDMFRFLPAGAELSPVQEIEAIERSLGRRHVSGESRLVGAAPVEGIERSVALHEEKRAELATEEEYRRAEPHLKKRDAPATKLLAGTPGMPQRLKQSGGSAAVAGSGTGGGANPRREERGVLVLRETAAGVNRPLRESRHEAVAYHSIRNGYIPDGMIFEFHSRSAARRKTQTAHDTSSQKQSKNSNHEPDKAQADALLQNRTTRTANYTTSDHPFAAVPSTIAIVRASEAIITQTNNHQGRTENRTNPEREVPNDRYCTVRPA